MQHTITEQGHTYITTKARISRETAAIVGNIEKVEVV